MPRKDFRTHLKDAQSRQLPGNIRSVQPGEDDGTFVLRVQCEDSQDIHIHVQASDVGDYPRNHSFFIYTNATNLSSAVSSALTEISVLDGITIFETVSKISSRLSTNELVEEQDEDLEMEDEYLDSEDDMDEAFCALDDEDFRRAQVIPSALAMTETAYSTHPTTDDSEDIYAQKIRTDLQVVKKAGFRISHFGKLLTPGVQCYLLLSIRVSKLGISEDTLQAWRLQDSEYIMLVINYKHGYRAFHDLKSTIQARNSFSMHVLVTKRHKMSKTELEAALEDTKKQENDTDVAQKISTLDSNVRPLFIGSALTELLNSKFFTLVQYRSNSNLNWAGAMACYNHRQGHIDATGSDISRFESEKDISIPGILPDIVKADHLRDASRFTDDKVSLPCAAMQFTIRHLVHCTKFCLVCFDKVDEDFEALKPYVCSKPLCLYQYMSMGFGPAIEFEILSQPKVVDLLVSFCYCAASDWGLRSTPKGLGLAVPDPQLMPGIPCQDINQLSRTMMDRLYGASPAANPSLLKSPQNSPNASASVLGEWNSSDNILRIASGYNIELNPLRSSRQYQSGDWLVFWTTDQQLYHAKVGSVEGDTYSIRHLIKSRSKFQPEDPKWMSMIGRSSYLKTDIVDLTSSSPIHPVQIIPYGKTFDDLTLTDQQSAIRAMLDTLPGVSEMSEYLQTAANSNRGLSKWIDQINPVALTLLRWIVVSNRSCIVYTKDNPEEELVWGMNGYTQFRFLSGAPDKESRFLKNVRDKYKREKKDSACNTETIFAWHGSPTKNWHSIIRTGLDFNNTINGRSYGDGVYHALDVRTSLAYCGGKPDTNHWPSSKLNITRTLSLNEILNSPHEFKSSNPYLVVQHVDWIQTRYLFVSCLKDEENDMLEVQHPQSKIVLDSRFLPKGNMGEKLEIPLCAMSKSRQLNLKESQKVMVGRDVDKGSLRQQVKDAINLSDDSDVEDISLYQNSTDLTTSYMTQDNKQTNLTDFVPGRLDRSDLLMLPPPAYASTISSKALQRELRSMMTEQRNVPLQELGWYMDPQHLDNPYQWIVELHSFDNDLSLAKDMKAQKVESIVLEVRFGANFNFSPPFIRVVRPRFLGFMFGGGGHVTAGGALCMELLTSSGWNPSSTMAAVLLQVRLAITSLDPKPARLEKNGAKRQYSVQEAIEAYIRACRAHGWKVPDDFEALSKMGVVTH